MKARTSITLEESVLEAAETAAKKDNRTVSNFIELLLIDKLKLEVHA